MLSSLNTINGSSTSGILSLFGATTSRGSSLSSSASTPVNAASSDLAASVFVGADPVATMKAILARSQIAQTSMNGKPLDTERVATLYAEHTSGATGAGDGLTMTSSWIAVDGHAGLDATIAETSQNASIVASSAVTATVGSVAAPSVHSDSTSAVADANAPGNSLHIFNSMAFRSGDASVSFSADVGFSSDLGSLTLMPNSNSFYAHVPDAEHAYSDLFQFNMFAYGTMNSVSVNIAGLTSFQVQDVLTTFQNAAATAHISSQAFGDGDASRASLTYVVGAYISWTQHSL